VTSLPFGYLLKSLIIKIYRKFFGKMLNSNDRLMWTVTSVSDAIGPTDNVRNYLERNTIRRILEEITYDTKIISACEIGCGYGRIIMVLKEFAQKVIGFERESHLVHIARDLLPDIEMIQVESIDKISEFNKGPFDFAMTCTVLQHLPDDFCKMVLLDIHRMVPSGHVLLIEKTEDISTTENIHDATLFISRARPIETYKEWMKSFEMIGTWQRILEPTYFNKSPGTCMLFKR
jgi:protein-L-isoaspartate O-methyltransferase